jgi:hypothetical protein
MILVTSAARLSPETRNNGQRSHGVRTIIDPILEYGRRFTGVFLVHKNF